MSDDPPMSDRGSDYFDIRAWVSNLDHYLAEVGAAFRDAKTPAKQRRAAGGVVAQMMLGLQELGALSGRTDGAQEAVVGLLQMIGDLDHGRRHPWAEPVSFGGSNIQSANHREVRLWAVIGVRLLREEGLGAEAGYRRIAKALTLAGLQGRQSRDQPFPPETVKGWCHRPRNEAESERIQSAIDAANADGGAEDYVANKSGLLAMLMRSLNSVGFG